MKRVKVCTGYTAHARLLAEAGEIVGFLPRAAAGDIPSPYRYSPDIQVFKWRGKNVFWRETRHCRYEVFEVPAGTELLDYDAAMAL